MRRKKGKKSFCAVDTMGDNHDEDKDEYKVPTKVGLNELMERDKDDAAMESYKKSLLGAAQYARTCVSVCTFQLTLHASSASVDCTMVAFDLVPASDLVYSLRNSSVAHHWSENWCIVFLASFYDVAHRATLSL